MKNLLLIFAFTSCMSIVADDLSQAIKDTHLEKVKTFLLENKPLTEKRKAVCFELADKMIELRKTLAFHKTLQSNDFNVYKKYADERERNFLGIDVSLLGLLGSIVALPIADTYRSNYLGVGACVTLAGSFILLMASFARQIEANVHLSEKMYEDALTIKELLYDA